MNFNEAYIEFEGHWYEPHRHYHGHSHLQFMLENGPSHLSYKYFALFHDIVYDPRSSTNEEDSASLFKNNMDSFTDIQIDDKVLIISMILASKDHKPTGYKTIDEAVEIDMAVLNGTFEELLKYEEGIFLEYQFNNIDSYRKGRLDFLAKNRHRNPFELDRLMEHIRTKKYRVGIYPGSFNPFHIGHLNILRKAEAMFDKVILVRAQNPEKRPASYHMPQSLLNECIFTSGLITDVFKNPPKNVEYFMVRGIRNEYDIAAEMNYQAWVSEMALDADMDSIPFVHIFCDSEFVKISSSFLNSMLPWNDFKADKYIVR